MLNPIYVNKIYSQAETCRGSSGVSSLPMPWQKYMHVYNCISEFIMYIDIKVYGNNSTEDEGGKLLKSHYLEGLIVYVT